ncbi:MAG: hypothetical protein R3336_03535, partial [Phycisphaeraceae bacterium]|nr:hypothetical protein [Phycisphaeraceae bacterium]
GGRVDLSSIHEVPITTDGPTLVMAGDTSNFWYWQYHMEDRDWLRGAREYVSDELIVLDFEARVRVLHEGGSIEVADDHVTFDGCDTVTLLLAADTNYVADREQGWRGEHPHDQLCALIRAAASRPYEDLREEHENDFSAMVDRMTVDLGETPTPEAESTKTGDRVVAYRQAWENGEAPDDRELEGLLYRYGRYLMISSSRPGHGVLPANLQGIWLINKKPSWRCDFHTDINLQMNYWMADPSNLADCFPPLAHWLDSIREVRKEETRRVVGVDRGWLMRSENGIFGGSTYFIQKGDSAWVCQNLWDHFAFTRDHDYLREYAYPIMREISEFWIDHLKELDDGTLVAPDGRSPEHGPPSSDGVTYDQELAWDLFTNTHEAAGALGVDDDLRAQLADCLDRLYLPRIGRWGQLQEWMDDIDDPEDDHRHFNHLIGVYPGRRIAPSITPELAEAARVSIEARRDHGDEHPGWSRVWKACVFARLLDGDSAWEQLVGLVGNKLYDNLWAVHPPFQIDANFGYAAAINEMLVQSHLGEIHLLPALPSAWPEGQMAGLRARGGFGLDLAWKDGGLTRAVIRGISNDRPTCRLRYGDQTWEAEVGPGEQVEREF